MSRELRIGILALIVLATFFWGFNYIKGKNLLSKSFTFKSTYSDVTQLTKSSPVYINGFRVGSVLNIKMNENNLREMVVTFEVEKDYKIPKDATVFLVSDGIVGGKALSIQFENLCQGPTCAQDGDFLDGKIKGFLGSIMGDQNEFQDYADIISNEFTETIEKLGSEDAKGAVNETLRNLSATMENMEEITHSLNILLKRTSSNLDQTVSNINQITGNLAENNEKITSVMANIDTITRQLSQADIGNTIESTTATVDEAKLTMENLQNTLSLTDDVMKNLNEVLSKTSTGEGSLSKLLNDKELYDNLTYTSENLALLLQDLRLNPKRYVNVSIFGKKSKEYTKPENDPAFIDEEEK